MTSVCTTRLVEEYTLPLEGYTAQVFYPELTGLQRHVLTLLGVPHQEFRPSAQAGEIHANFIGDVQKMSLVPARLRSAEDSRPRETLRFLSSPFSPGYRIPRTLDR